MRPEIFDRQNQSSCVGTVTYAFEFRRVPGTSYLSCPPPKSKRTSLPAAQPFHRFPPASQGYSPSPCKPRQLLYGEIYLTKENCHANQDFGPHLTCSLNCSCKTSSQPAIVAIKDHVTGKLRGITTYSSATQKKDNIVCFQAEKTRKKTL